MNTENTIDVLNTLIVINHDRIEGYKTALKETKDADLQRLFVQFEKTSTLCLEELNAEVGRLGGTAEEGTRATGKFFRGWMELKAALTTNERRTVLDSCEYGEDVALETYKKAQEDHKADLTDELQSMLDTQYTCIKADHDCVKAMRDTLV
jgi:uncharacterized protein (TIGR02284 family)